MNPSENFCQRCESPLPAARPGGICPACLMGAAVGDLESLPDTVRTDLTESRGAESQADPLEGTTLGIGGRYKILQRIGEGGFGTVYMAEQSVPVRRRVAIKILKAGLDTRQMLARFESERQALAMMDHPNIAKVLDGGETGQGRPFFVMELVTGTPTTTFCAREGYGLEQRLNLCCMVCAAVQHAHQKGVIHRDLKPSNVLVTDQEGRPVPKVIDFGVAKALEGPLTDKTFFTRFEQMIGTPAYMSPEQAGLSGLDVDTRSDVYSLGVLLYELLTGSTPFDSEVLGKAAFDEMRRIIREDEPPTPSSRLTDTRRRREDKVRTASHLRSVPSDLDWVVMKALEKDRRRRYDTAEGLAQDLERFLRNEPVTAGPPGLGYRSRKFLRRNRTAVVAGGVVLAALATGAGLAVVGFHRAEKDRGLAVEAREEAKREAAIAKEVNAFLRHDLLAQANPLRLPGAQNVPLKEVLDRAAATVDSRFPNEPEVRASIHYTLATTYFGIGDLQVAEKHARKAAEIFESLYGWDHAPTLMCFSLVASIVSERDHGAALAVHRKVFERRRDLLGAEDLSTLSSESAIASLLGNVGRHAEAEARLRKVLETQRRLFGVDHAESLGTQGSLIRVLFSQGVPAKQEEAIGLGQHRVQALEECCGEDAPSRLKALHDLATMYGLGNQNAEAEVLHREVLAKSREQFGEEHPRTVVSMGNLGSTLANQGKFEEAIPLLRRALEGEEARGGEAHPGTLSVLNSLGSSYGEMERPEMAIPLFEKVLELGPEVFGENHPNLLSTVNSLARMHALNGELDKAIALQEETERVLNADLGEHHPRTLGQVAELARTLSQTGRGEEAEVRMREVCAAAAREIGANHLETAQHLSTLGGILQEFGNKNKAKAGEAARVFKQVLDIRRQHLEEDHPRIIETRTDWIVSRKMSGEVITKEEEEELWRFFRQGANQRQAAGEVQSEPVVDLEPRLLFEVVGEQPGDQFGRNLASAGDVNGDGLDDLAVSAYSNGRKACYVRIVSGRDGAEIRSFRQEDAPNSSLGATGKVAIGDLDGDAITEFALWDRRDDSAGEDSGKAVLLSGTSGEIVRTHLGSNPAAFYGRLATGLGDLDGDGVGDYGVSDSINPKRPARFDLFSAASGEQLLWFRGDGTRHSRKIAGIGDLNGDGVDDLAVATWDWRYKLADPIHYQPEIWLISGSLRGEQAIAELPGEAILGRIQREALSGERYDRIWSVGDLDGDQVSDLAVDVFFRSKRLRTIAAISPRDGTRLWTMTPYATRSISSQVMRMGDLNGDGVTELVVVVRDQTARLRILSGKEGSILHSKPLEGIGQAALTVLGDLNGDGVSEIAIRDGGSGAPAESIWKVRVYSFSTEKLP